MQPHQHVLEHAVVLEYAGALERAARPSAAISCGASIQQRSNNGSRRVGRRNPVTALNAVVLPAPFGPIRPTIAVANREIQVGRGDEP
jgi:hypothetical protein